ncbi:MAG: YhfC family glutamic-type intramembrane protease [Anaerolineae bacterium]
MRDKYILILMFVLILGLLTGCAETADEPIVGATASGALNREEAGSELAYHIVVENEGDPVGIDFRGVLTQGSVSLQLVDADDEIIRDWTFDQVGPFSMNTTLYLAPGAYRYGMVWDGPVQLTQYSLAWKPHPIDVPTITPWVLLSGIGMIVVAVGYVAYAAVRRLGWGYLGLGALAWAITVALKFAWALPTNTPVYEALTGALPGTAANVIFYIYVGALTGLTEIALTWLVLRYTKWGQVPWTRVLAFGLGFGAVEALLLGVGSLIGTATALLAPTSLPLGTLRQIATANNPLYGLAPVSERFFTVLIHLFSNVLLFYGARQRESRWFWLAFAYKSGIDAVAAFAQFWGIGTVGRIWTIELIILLWGVVGWWGTRAVRDRYPPLTQDDAGAA